MEQNLYNLKHDLINKIHAFNLTWIDIPDQYIVPIHDLFFKCAIDKYNESEIYLSYVGIFYQFQSINSALSEKYYLMAAEKGSMIATNNLGLTYRNAGDYVKAEKYLLKSIEYGADSAIHNLITMYYKIEKYDLATKYCFMLMSTNHISIHEHINKILNSNFDIELAVAGRNYLNLKNTAVLNNTLEYMQENKNSNHNGRLFDSMDCVVCEKTSIVLFLYCGHSICIKCFKENANCRLCKNTEYINEPVTDRMNITTPQEGNSENTINEMRIALQRKMFICNVICDAITDEELLVVYDLFFKNIVDDKNTSTIYISYLAIYYTYQKLCDANSRKYYLEAISRENIAAMINYADRLYLSGDYKNAEMYYLKAVEKNNCEAMYKLAKFYAKNDKTLSKKYYLLSALNYNIKARHKINSKLEKKFNIRLAVESESFLNKKNIQTMNKCLAYFYSEQ